MGDYKTMAKWQDKDYPKPSGICIVGCYTLHLYCANPNDAHGYKEGSDEFGGVNWLECVQQARKFKWRLDFKLDLAICPECVKKEKQL